MVKVLILKPRMDVMFKKGQVPSERGHIPPIRQHWIRFVEKLSEYHTQRGDSVFVLELPLWQFTPELVVQMKPDLVYVPHKERHAFEVPGIKTLYYMQTVFPWRFYVDSLGFAGGSTLYPMDHSDGDENGPHFDALREYALKGGSKFDQPQHKDLSLPNDYVFFPCQIPHDETIKYHSDYTVEEALTQTCEATKELGHPLIVKGHPVNPASMSGLKLICAKYDHAIWVDDVSIHDLIPRARAVVVVNSGTGMESLLHLRPVITFGRCEYDSVTMKAISSGYLKDYLASPEIDEKQVRKMFDKWCKLTYDSNYNLDLSPLL